MTPAPDFEALVNPPPDRRCQRCGGAGVVDAVNSVAALAYLLGTIDKPRAMGTVLCPQCEGRGYVIGRENDRTAS